ncbi:MAG: protein kinase [Polyangiaceae bacterium]|nr:protein kinase [Polyangiaceae bacterium]
MVAQPAKNLIGVGAVFEVRHFREDGRDLVEKRLLPRVRREPLARAALAREAHVLSKTKHRALPELVRVGMNEHGPYLVETFLPGASIRQVVDVWSQRGGVPHRLAAHIVRQAFHALSEIASLTGEKGPLHFVHGDLGPDHLIVTEHGDVWLLDFGASHIRDLPIDLKGQDRGTLPFAAPEVARGEAPTSVITDVYSMAATALFLATGEPLCDAKDTAAMLVEVGTRGVKRHTLQHHRAFRPKERAALLAALSPDPTHRPKHPKEVADEFDND